MADSAVRNPLSPFYSHVKHIMTSSFHKEFFAADAETLLSNSNNYLARSTILNRNAAGLAGYFATQAACPDSPVRKVLYPTKTDTRGNYEEFMRKSTPEFAPGYGCLLSVEFEDVETAQVFYDNLQLHCGQHLGAHLTLALPFNALANGRTPEEVKYHASYGARPEQIRFSVGLEDQGEIVAAVEEAFGKANESCRSRKCDGGVLVSEIQAVTTRLE